MRGVTSMGVCVIFGIAYILAENCLDDNCDQYHTWYG